MPLTRKLSFNSPVYPKTPAEFVMKELVKPGSTVSHDVNMHNNTVEATRVFEYKTKKDEENGFCYIPKWFLVLTFLFCIALLIVFLAALIIVLGAKRNALYGESCSDRSCIKKFNLKCINKTCSCYTNEYYTNKCLTKKTYLQRCSKEIKMCIDNTGLECIDGACKCLNTQYWDESKCQERKNYKTKCIGDQCLSSLMLECINKTCLCNSSRFWDGNVCAIKRWYQESCSNVIQCDERKYLTCISNTCGCITRKYYSPIFDLCLNSLNEFDICLNTYQCLTPMTCLSGKCQCGTYQYYDNLTMSCLSQTSYNTICTKTLNCRVDQGLSCQSGVCLCNQSTPNWVSSINSCYRLLNYGETTCNDTWQCKPGLGLSCRKTLSNNCNCPTSSLVGMCDCTKTSFNENYWDGTSCVPALSYGQTCTNGIDYMCKTIQENTICNGTCSCQPGDYYFTNNNKCQSCPTNWFFANNTCYNLNTATTTSCWSTAQITCNSFNNGRLAQLSDLSLLTGLISSGLLNGKKWWVGARAFGLTGSGCSSGCPSVKWVTSSTCNSCGGNNINPSCSSNGCSSYSCWCGGGGGCGASNECRCSSTVTFPALYLNPIINLSNTTECLLFDGFNNWFDTEPCQNNNNFLCQS